jgi:hypothetical protein
MYSMPRVIGLKEGLAREVVGRIHEARRWGVAEARVASGSLCC